MGQMAVPRQLVQGYVGAGAGDDVRSIPLFTLPVPWHMRHRPLPRADWAYGVVISILLRLNAITLLMKQLIVRLALVVWVVLSAKECETQGYSFA